jgi:glycosyltransferase involved in cell wall biosynthesis
MKIAFYAGGSIPVHAATLSERPLGGTETALIRVAEELYKRSHEVTVFTAHKDPPPVSGAPRYLPAHAIHEIKEPFDLLIVVQQWKPLFFPLPAKRLWFWTGDGAEQHSNYGIGDKRIIERTEKLLAVSEYHARTLAAASGFPREKIAVVGNGVHLPYFEGEEVRDPYRIIFSSAPYRGLSLIPEILLRVRDKVPEVTFHSFSGMNLYDGDTPFQGPHVAHYKKVAQVLSAIPGVVLHGPVTQGILAREYMRSTVYLYPCTVPETCCITALEAQAGGCALITSSLGALPESVNKSGIVIQGEPTEKRVLETFAARTIELLNNRALTGSFSHRGRTRACKELGWEHVVDRVESQL